jgi:acyl-CoA thioesterase FadM
MGHVNNAVYADWLDEAVIAAGDTAATRAIPRLARLEYAAPAAAGATVSAESWPEAGGWSLRLRDEAGHELVRARLEGTVTAGTAPATSSPTIER